MNQKNYLKIFFILLLLLIIRSVFAQNKASVPAFVKLDNQKVLVLKNSVGSIDSQLRAQIVSKRIKEIADDKSFDPENIYVEPHLDFDNINIKDKIIISVTDKDAKVEEKLREELTNEYVSKIKKSIKIYRNNHKMKFWLKAIAKTIAATLFIIIFIYFLHLLFEKLRKSMRLKALTGLKIQKTQLFSRSKVIFAITIMSKIAATLIAVFALYFYFVLIFSFYPSTINLSSVLFRNFTDILGGFIFGFAAYIPKLFFITLCIVIAYYISMFIKFLFSEMEKGKIAIKGFYPEWSNITSRICRGVVYLITLAVILPYFPGANTDAFKIISIFFGVLISLGSSSALSNMITGIILTYTRAFKVGDRLKIDNTVGDVFENTLLVTRIKTIKNEIISVPNSVVIASHIINYSFSAKESGLILNTTISLGYEIPWQKAHEILIKAALATENILVEPEPFVLQLELSDFYIKYQINAYTNHPELMQSIYSELHKNIHEKFNEEKIEILSPHYFSLRRENRSSFSKD